jgi:hypothetical protein
MPIQPAIRGDGVARPIADTSPVSFVRLRF